MNDGVQGGEDKGGIAMGGGYFEKHNVETRRGWILWRAILGLKESVIVRG